MSGEFRLWKEEDKTGDITSKSAETLERALAATASGPAELGKLGNC